MPNEPTMRKKLLTWLRVGRNRGQAEPASQEQSTLLSPSMGTDLNSSKIPTGAKSLILYSSLDDIPLKVYVEVICNHDLTHISGATVEDKIATAEVLADQWEAAISGKDLNDDILVFAEIKKLELDIMRIDNLIDTIEKIGAFPLLVDELEQEGYSIDVNSDLAPQLQAFRNQQKQYELQLQALYKVIKKESGTGKVDKMLFIRSCIRISEHLKYHIDYNSITAMEFCIYYRNFCDYIDVQKSK